MVPMLVITCSVIGRNTTNTGTISISVLAMINSKKSIFETVICYFLYITGILMACYKGH